MKARVVWQETAYKNIGVYCDHYSISETCILIGCTK